MDPSDSSEPHVPEDVSSFASERREDDDSASPLRAGDSVTFAIRHDGSSMHDSDPSTDTPIASSYQPSESDIDALREILIDLRCVSCGYNLKRIALNRACPECGLAVRRTLLYVVDPALSEIASLQNAVKLGLFLTVIPFLLFASTVVLWIPHLLFVIENLSSSLRTPLFGDWFVSRVVTAGVILSAGVLLFGGLRHPAGQKRRQTYDRGLFRAAVGLILWGAFVFAIAWFDHKNDSGQSSLYNRHNINIVRSVLRLGADAALFLSITGFPAILRFLALRSLYHRVTQVSQQGFLAMGVAVGVMAAGDLSWITAALLYGGHSNGSGVASTTALKPGVELAAQFGTVLVIVGGAMLTLAMANAVIDAARLARRIAGPRFTMKQIVG